MRRRPTAVLAAMLTIPVLLAGCGGGSGDSDSKAYDSPGASPSGPPSASTSGTPSPTAAPSSPSAADQAKAVADFLAENGQKPPKNTPSVSGDVGTTPTIAEPVGQPPAKIVIKDLVPGNGAPATLLSQVRVDYHGVRWDDGKVFDSSFTRGEPATFSLQGLITCWQAGIPGMKVGGRRELICPPTYAYGEAGSGHELAGKTLVFVIDLKKVA